MNAKLSLGIIVLLSSACGASPLADATPTEQAKLVAADLCTSFARCGEWRITCETDSVTGAKTCTGSIEPTDLDECRGRVEASIGETFTSCGGLKADEQLRFDACIDDPGPCPTLKDVQQAAALREQGVDDATPEAGSAACKTAFTGDCWSSSAQ